MTVSVGNNLPRHSVTFSIKRPPSKLVIEHEQKTAQFNVRAINQTIRNYLVMAFSSLVVCIVATFAVGTIDKMPWVLSTSLFVVIVACLTISATAMNKSIKIRQDNSNYFIEAKRFNYIDRSKFESHRFINEVPHISSYVDEVLRQNRMLTGQELIMLTNIHKDYNARKKASSSSY